MPVLWRMPAHRFNTQPPEGGWRSNLATPTAGLGFNTQPPEGGWFAALVEAVSTGMFQHTAA